MVGGGKIQKGGAAGQVPIVSTIFSHMPIILCRLNKVLDKSGHILKTLLCALETHKGNETITGAVGMFEGIVNFLKAFLLFSSDSI